MKDAKLFCSLDRTIYLPVAASVFAIVLFSFMMLAERPGFGRSDLPAVNYPIWIPDANDEDAAVVTLLENGRVFWGGDPTSVGELSPRLLNVLQRRPNSPIYLAVDARTRYRDLSNVLAALRSANVSKIVFLVEQRKYWTAFIDDWRPQFWDAAYRWRSTDWLLRADFILLVFMLANTGAIVVSCLYRYRCAVRQFRAFNRDALSALHEGKFQNVIDISAGENRRPFDPGIRASLIAYALTPSHFSHAEAFQFAQGAYQRRSRLVYAGLEAGLGTLSMITCSATFIGFLGTVYGITYAFRGTSGSKSTGLSQVASEIAIAVLFGAMGLLVSVLALWCFNYLRGRLEMFQCEMSNAHSDVIERLNAHPEWREPLRLSLAGGNAGPTDFVNRDWEVP